MPTTSSPGGAWPWPACCWPGSPARWRAARAGSPAPRIYIQFKKTCYAKGRESRRETPARIQAKEEVARMSKILIVDDDPHIRQLARTFLQQAGFDIVEAADGVEALDALRAGGADLVILDLMLPRMDGWEVCRRVRAAGETPVLMLTARGETSQKVR